MSDRNGAEGRTRPAFMQPILLGFWVIAITLGGFLAWSLLVPIAEGTRIEAKIGYNARSITLNHDEGGRIETINARIGSFVEKGSPILRFATGKLETDLAIVQGRIERRLAEQARLEAEARFAETLTWEEALEQRVPADLIRQEEERFVERQEELSKQQSLYRSQMAQARRNIEGLEQRISANLRSQTIIEEEHESLSALLEKGNVSKFMVLERERQMSDLDGNLGAFRSQIAQAEEKIQELELSIRRIRQQYRQRAVERLAEVDEELDELQEQEQRLKDSIANAILRAPEDGWIDDLYVTVVGMTIGRGAPIAEFVPASGDFIAIGRLSPIDAEGVNVGMPTTLEFRTFSQRTPPRVEAEVGEISAGVLEDERSGERYYRVLIEIDPQDPTFLQIRDRLRVGMPTEALIKSGERTFAVYAMQPFAEMVRGAFHE